MADEEQAAGPLTGLTVLDTATMLAGPYGATLLGDLGADVIKIEPPRGDDTRSLGPERGGERAPFISVNRNKRSIVLDLREPADREAFGKLAATADALTRMTLRRTSTAQIPITVHGRGIDTR